MTYNEEAEAEIAQAIEAGRKKRRSATVETSSAQVQESIELHVSPLNPRPDGRLLQLEILSLTADRLPAIQKELGRDHPLTKEWRRVHQKTISFLDKDSTKRLLKHFDRTF